MWCRCEVAQVASPSRLGLAAILTSLGHQCLPCQDITPQTPGPTSTSAQWQCIALTATGLPIFFTPSASSCPEDFMGLVEPT